MKRKREWIYDYAGKNSRVKIDGKIYIIQDIEILEEEINSNQFTFNRNYILRNITNIDDKIIIEVRNQKNLPLFLQQEQE